MCGERVANEKHESELWIAQTDGAPVPRMGA
jgi:hypothetical protein